MKQYDHSTPGLSRQDLLKEVEETRERFKKLPIEQQELMAKKRRQRGMMGMKLTNPPTFSGNEKLCNCLKGIFYDVSDMGQFDETYKIALWRMNENLMIKCIDTTPGETAFHEYLKKIYKLVCAQHDKLIADTKVRVQRDQDHIKFREDVFKFVEDSLLEMRQDQVIEQQSKVQQKPVFVKEDLSTWPALPESDAVRSRQNSTDEKVEMFKKQKDYDKKISELEHQITPLNTEIEERKARLEDDNIDESQYKETRLEIDFRQAKVDKLIARIQKHQTAKDELQGKFKDLDRQISVLDCCIDRYNLVREARNWSNRRQRAIERVMRVLKDRDGLTQLRTSLKKRFEELTGDTQDLCEPLILRADSKLYFL